MKHTKPIMTMLTASKKSKMIAALKDYKKRFLGPKMTDLDESGTRLMINHFLTEILGYVTLEEVKTEYMIRGTYAGYVVQVNGVRHFLVEVKALMLTLSDKHLRQAINYGANEGIEWAILTNGRSFELYKIIFDKPIEHKKIFVADLTEIDAKKAAEMLQSLHKDAVNKKSLPLLWNKHSALDTYSLAGLLYDKSIIGFLKRELKKRYKSKFESDEITDAISHLLSDAVDLEKVKIPRSKVKIKTKKPLESVSTENTSDQIPE